MIKAISLSIYTYILSCHPQRDCFDESQSFSEATHVGRLKLGPKPAQLYVRLSILPLSHQATCVSSGITKHYVVAFICLHFTLPNIRVLNSLKELSTTHVAAINSFARVLNPRGSGIRGTSLNVKLIHIFQ